MISAISFIVFLHYKSLSEYHLLLFPMGDRRFHVLFFFLLMYMLFRCLGCRNFIQNPVFPIFNRSGFGTETDTYLYEFSVVSLERNHVAFSSIWARTSLAGLLIFISKTKMVWGENLVIPVMKANLMYSSLALIGA